MEWKEHSSANKYGGDGNKTMAQTQTRSRLSNISPNTENQPMLEIC